MAMLITGEQVDAQWYDLLSKHERKHFPGKVRDIILCSNSALPTQILWKNGTDMRFFIARLSAYALTGSHAHNSQGGTTRAKA
jgi:hypothetical protein